MPDDNILDALVGREEEMLALFMQTNADRFALTLEEYIDGQLLAGVDPDQLAEDLLNDLTGNGRLFGEFRNAIRATASGGLNRLRDAGEFAELGVISTYRWVAVLINTCPDCIERHNMEARTWEKWEEIGLPRTGNTVCRQRCRCMLVPADVVKEGAAPIKRPKKDDKALRMAGKHKTLEQAKSWAKANGIADDIKYDIEGDQILNWNAMGRGARGGKPSQKAALATLNRVNKVHADFQLRYKKKLPSVDILYLRNLPKSCWAYRGKADGRVSVLNGKKGAVNITTSPRALETRSDDLLRSIENMEKKHGTMFEFPDQSRGGEVWLEVSIRHEWMHIIDFNKIGSMQSWRISSTQESALKFIELKNRMTREFGAQWRKQVSNYAGKNDAEFLAEAFCIYTSPAYKAVRNGKRYARFPEYLEKYLDEIIGELEDV